MCVCVFLPLEQHALDSISFLVPVQPQIQCYLCWLPHRPPTEQPDKPRDHHPKSSQCALSHPPIYLTTTPQTIPLASNSPFESDSPRIDNNRVTSTPSDGHSSLFHQHHHYSSSQHRHHQKLYHKKSSLLVSVVARTLQDDVRDICFVLLRIFYVFFFCCHS